MEAFVLAGGESKRFGSSKALHRLDGVTLVEHACNRLSSLFDRVRVLAKDPAPFNDIPFEALSDVREETCPLSGIYTGLKTLDGGKAFFLACDLPLVQESLVQYIVSQSLGSDAVVPSTSKGLEPLCAVYDVSCVDAIESSFSSGDLRADSFLKGVSSKIIEEEELRRYDSELLTFTNVNRPGDVDLVAEMLCEE